MTRRLAYAAAQFVLASGAWLSPLQAWAQILPPLPLPLPGSLIVTMTSPGNGAPVSGTVTVSASVSIVGSLTVARVEFYRDGTTSLGVDTSNPYAVSWNTTTTSNGSHTVRAVARDILGVAWNSNTVTVTVSNGPPPDTTAPSVPSGVTATAVSSSRIDLSWTASTDNVGVTGYRVYRGGTQIATTSTTSYANTGLSPSTTYSYTVAAFDAAGNLSAQSSPASATTPAPSDATPPTVSLTSPADGDTVSETVSVMADASDNVGVTQVQFFDGTTSLGVDTTNPYAVSWNTTTTSNGSHTLTAVARDAAGNTTTSGTVTVTISNGPPPTGGDVFVALDTEGTPPDLQGAVLWYNPDGSLRRTLKGASNGQASSVAFDAAGNIYVPHWYSPTGKPGNLVERFDPNGNFLGAFGCTKDANGNVISCPYNEAPSSIAFDAAGFMYVGHADPPGDILKFDTAGNRVDSFDVLTTVRGTDHIALASDNCTIFYTSRDKNIYRYNVCTKTQLPQFNNQSLPGETAYHLVILPDGGVLVADSEVLVRLDASGNLLQTYFVTGASQYYGGVDLVGDGTFWATNAATDDVVKFDLQSGAVLLRFNTGTGGLTAAGVGVRR